MKYINIRMRLWALLLAMVSFMVSANLAFNREIYAAPVYDAVKAISFEAWEVMWLFVGILSMVASISARSIAWRMALIGGMWVGSFWTITLCYEVIFKGAQISLAGLSLWIFFCLSNLIVSTSRCQFDEIRQVKKELL